MKNNVMVMIGIALVGVAFAWAAYLYKSQEVQTQAEQVAQNAAALIRPHSPREGHPDARVTIVEFMDPACETCRDFYPFVKALLARYEGKVNLVIRYAAFHQGSDVMVKILEASKKQGQYWQMLDLMFDSQPGWVANHVAQPEIFLATLEKMGFDVPQLRQEISAPAYDEIVAQDLADARLLGANLTPTFFVNGKPLPSFGYEQLQSLVATEVAAKYSGS